MPDVATLSRFQFAFTISFHILFPAMTIGLALFIATCEGLWLKTRNLRYLQLAKFWIKPFAITFGMGVVSGIVLSYEFGTNFAPFSEKVGAILGPLLTYEVMTAFFLEAGFLGVMLFGWNRVSPKMHFMASVVVAIGTLLSAFWILSANSWMQTPAGYAIQDGHFVPTDWWQIVFNPSFPYRFVHMVLAALITSSFLVAGVSAWYLLKKRDIEFARKGLSMALWAMLILTPLQVVVGDFHGLEVKEHQPIKLAAMEGIWDKVEQPAALRLFAWPDMQQEKDRWSLAIPHLGSLILTHSWDGAVQGLKSVKPEDRPYVPLVFYSFRVMVAIGFLMVATAFWGLWLRRKGRFAENPRFLKLLCLMTPSGLVATLAGWYVVETGRQPWLVEGLLRTKDVISPLPAQRVAFSLILFVIVYSLLGYVFVHFYRKLIRKGPPSLESLAQLASGQQKTSLAPSWQGEPNGKEA